MRRRALSRDESKAITRQRLLHAAARLLGEVGYGGLSTGAVARAAGVAQPTFYVHFRDMDDLLRTLGTEQMGALRARLRAAREGLIAGRGVEAVRETFRVPKVGTIAGCMVQDGRITRSGDAHARLLRDNVVVWEGKLASLRRFKDDVSEVKAGFECGIGLQNYNDVKLGDVIEVFTMERVAAAV